MVNVKPGYRTTEFWVVGLPGLLLSVVSGLTDWGLNLPGWAGPIMAGIYALTRGFVKK